VDAPRGQTTQTTMKAFLKEYGLWIAVPVVLVAIALVAALWLMGDQGASPFVYNIQ